MNRVSNIDPNKKKPYGFDYNDFPKEEKEEVKDTSGVLYQTRLDGMDEGEYLMTYIDHEGTLRDAIVLEEGKEPSKLAMTISEAMSKASKEITKLPIKTSIPNDWIEKIAMNIVYQLDDDAKLSVEFRQANNDKRIDFVKGLIQSSITQQKEAIEKERDEKWREKEEKLKFIIGDIYGYSPDGEIGTLCNKLLELLK